MRVFHVLLLSVFLWSACGVLPRAEAAPAPAKSSARKSASKKETAKSPAGKNKSSASPSAKKGSAASQKGNASKKGKKTGKRGGAREASLADSPGAREEPAAPRMVFVPVSVRGAGPRFERAVHACLFDGDGWLLANESETGAGETLARFSPTFVQGGMRLRAGTLPSAETAMRWNALRATLQQANSTVGFDIVLDLRGYSSPEAVTEDMRKAGALLESEAWTFLGAERAAGLSPALVAAAVDEAHAQGRSVGIALSGEGGYMGQDYSLVCYGNGGGSLDERIRAGGKRADFAAAGAAGRSGGVPGRASKTPLPVLVLSGASFSPNGEGFAMGKTPSQRRIMVMKAAKAQKKGVWYAFPVFGPLASEDKAYDAGRDEFMLDTIERAMQENNPIAALYPLEDKGGDRKPGG